MADQIKINEATPNQLSALLGINEESIIRIVTDRPYHNKAQLSWLPIHALEKISTSLEFQKLDINSATKEQIASLSGVTENIASAITTNRPYYLSLELHYLPGVDPSAFDDVTAIFGVGALQYFNKITGKTVELKADSSHLLVHLNEQETGSAMSLASRSGLRVVSIGEGYQVLAVPEGETGVGKITNIKHDRAVEKVVPAFRNPDGAIQYIDPDYCIVQFKDGVSQDEQEAIIKSTDLTIKERHRTPGLVTLKIRSSTGSPMKIISSIRDLNNSPAVAFVEPGFIAIDDMDGVNENSINRNSRPTKDTESTGLDWNLKALGCEAAWASTKGTPDVIIALIDTGVDLTHPSLTDGLLQRGPSDIWNFESNDDPDPTDADGHGTFIAGLLIGNGQLGIHGICPNCRLLPLKVPLLGASLSYAKRRDAILYAISFTPPSKRLIISISWKTTGDVILIRDAIRQATESGALVVCSAGNWPISYNEVHYPSDYDNVISVAAIGADKKPASYSFLGDRVDLCAPGGSGITANDEVNIRSSTIDGTSYDFGTSFAVPHVVGSAALLMSCRNDIDGKSARKILEETAVPFDQTGTGRGMVRVDFALNQATLDHSEPVTDHSGSQGLIIINEWNEARLREVFQLLPITIRVLIARRPFSSLSDVRMVIGLTEDQYRQIEAYEPSGVPG